MMSNMKRLLAAVLFLMVSVPVRADTRKGSSTLSLFGGLGFSSSRYELGVTGGEEPVARGGGTFGGQWVYYFQESPSYGIGLDASGTHLSDRRTTDLVRGADTTSYLNSNVLLVIMKLSYPTGRVRPYVFGGVGAHHSHTFVSGMPYGGNTWSDTHTSENRVLLDETHKSLALGGGIGLEMYLTEQLFIGAEYRGVMLAHKRYEETPAAASAGLVFQKSDLDVQSLLLSIGVKFGPS